MNPRERLLGMGRLYLMRGEPIPLTLLAEAETYGLMLSEFEQPIHETEEQGAVEYDYTKEDFYD
jgi:hypothetical protein